jgi:hypothetical protein
MPIGDDFTITYNAGAYDIRHGANTNTYTVLELHRWLQDLADDSAFSGNDEVDITSPTPSERSTDNIITLSNGFNIDDDASEYFYDGSITQDGGDTVYSGLVVVGSVNRATILKIVQNNAFYDDQTAPFWSTITDNRAVAADNILLRCLVKTRESGVDIDGKKVRVTARTYLDTYAEFSLTLGLGNSTAAIFTNDDLNNDIVSGTISGWTEVTNTEGFDETNMDINDDSTVEPYYSRWTVSADPTGGDGNINDTYQWAKYITRDSTAKTVHGMNGELFRGITHSFGYDGESGGITLSTNDMLADGTLVVTGAVSGGPFTVGEAVHEDTATPVWVGRVIAVDAANTSLVVEVTSGTVGTGEGITGQSSSATATTSGVPTAVTGGGVVAVLADDATGDDLYVQQLSGATPVDDTRFYYAGTDLSTADTTDYLDVAGSVSAESLTPCFLGTSTGSNLIAAYGIGVSTDTGDTDYRPSVGDQFFPLDDTGPILPADVRAFSVGNLLYVAAGDGARVLVGPQDGSLNAFNFDQFTNDGPYSGGEATVTIETGAGAGDLTSIPSDTPSAGTFRMEGTDGVYHLVTYTGKTTTTFTGCTGTPAATDNLNIMISYIDDIYDENDGDSGDQLSYSARYSSARDLFVRVRYGGASNPLKTFESPSSFPGSISAIQTSDA